MIQNDLIQSISSLNENSFRYSTNRVTCECSHASSLEKLTLQKIYGGGKTSVEGQDSLNQKKIKSNLIMLLFCLRRFSMQKETRVIEL